jgi:hypothetical protein
MSEANTKSRESKLRSQARSKGFRLSRSKIRIATVDDSGVYRIVDALMNTIAAGEKYDLTLDDVEKFLEG